LEININGISATPRIINVKQYSNGVNTITFTLNTCPLEGKITAYVKSDSLKQEIPVTTTDNSLTAVWSIASAFTQESGSYNIQLWLENHTQVWLSDVMVLIVSESTEGEATSDNINPLSNYAVINTLTRIPKRLILDMITEKITETEE